MEISMITKTYLHLCVVWIPSARPVALDAMVYGTLQLVSCSQTTAARFGYSVGVHISSSQPENKLLERKVWKT